MGNKHTTNILKNLPGWWAKDETSINYKFVNSFEDEYQLVEDKLNQFKLGWQINYAQGKDLDKIALKYGLTRTQYDTDDSFRSKIKTYLLTFSGSGTEDDLKNILSFLTSLNKDDIDVQLIREMVISINISIDANTDVIILNDIVNYVPKIKAAGVYVLDINYLSKNNIFLTNLSTINGEDKIL